ncbi:hypothetical protein PENSPDRAFT_331517 [Peniophora sp. CONT]|nr:hypothetical protein PENSPDRAFT_331517 [Peniophora sp. CONT]
MNVRTVPVFPTSSFPFARRPPSSRIYSIRYQPAKLVPGLHLSGRLNSDLRDTRNCLARSARLARLVGDRNSSLDQSRWTVASCLSTFLEDTGSFPDLANRCCFGRLRCGCSFVGAWEELAVQGPARGSGRRLVPDFHHPLTSLSAFGAHLPR